MKLKMARNSLFGILMRSRWWVSFAVAGGVALIGAVLAPKPYAVLGALAGFPFFVVGCIAAWKQWGQPSPAQVEFRLAALAAMAWPEFSQLVEAAYQREGHEVTRLKSPAADFRIEKSGRTVLLSAKRWKANRVGIEPLRELAAAMDAHEAQGGIYLALGQMTDAAQAFATSNALVVVQGAELARLLPSGRK